MLSGLCLLRGRAAGDERVFWSFVEFSDGEVLFIEQAGEDIFVEGQAF